MSPGREEEHDRLMKVENLAKLPTDMWAQQVGIYISLSSFFLIESIFHLQPMISQARMKPDAADGRLQLEAMVPR